MSAGFLTAITGALAAGRGFNMADDVRDYGKNLYNVDANGNATGAMPVLGQQLADGSKFQGYGVTSGLGTSTVGSDGSINMGIGPDPQAYNAMLGTYETANQLMNQSAVNPYERQQQLYSQNMAAQNPMLNQMQAQQQANEYAMGRGGIRGSQFGGTAEDAAMARARVDGSNQAMMMAQQQALAEQGQQAQMATNYGQLANQYNQQTYMPMQQQMQLMQLAGADADRAQTGQLTGQGYLGQLNLGGIQARVNSMKAASELEGNIYDSIFDNAGSLVGGLFDIFKS